MLIHIFSFLKNRNYRHFYYKGLDTMIQVYMKSYTNLNGFFVGIIFGEMYLRYLKHEKNRTIVRRYLKYAPLIGWPIILGIWFLGTSIIFKETTIWTSMFAILHRHVSVAIVATVVIVRGMCTGGGEFKEIKKTLFSDSYLFKNLVFYNSF